MNEPVGRTEQLDELEPETVEDLDIEDAEDVRGGTFGTTSIST